MIYRDSPSCYDSAMRNLFRNTGRRLTLPGLLSSMLALCPMPNRTNGNPLAANPVENDIRSPGDGQFSHARLGTDPAQTRVSSECLDDGHDTHR